MRDEGSYLRVFADMRSVALLVPGRLDTPTGGYVYDRRIVEGLRQRGWAVDVNELDDSFPHPSLAARRVAADTLSSLPAGTVVLVDGLAFGAMPEVLACESLRLRFVAIVHLPLSWEVGLDAHRSAVLARFERRALSTAAAVVVTGPRTFEALAPDRISSGRLHLIEPGTDKAALSRGSNTPTVALLSVGSVTPGKGHDVLIRALATLRDARWTLTCAGSLARSPSFVDRVRGLVRDLDFADRVELAGELTGSALDECYDRADVFVLATQLETYGMAVAEALARGLPVVSTRTGAIPRLVGSDAGLLVAPGDTSALADAMRRVIGDADLRQRLAAGARRARDRFEGWDVAIRKMEAVLEGV